MSVVVLAAIGIPWALVRRRAEGCIHPRRCWLRFGDRSARVVVMFSPTTVLRRAGGGTEEGLVKHVEALKNESNREIVYSTESVYVFLGSFENLVAAREF